MTAQSPNNNSNWILLTWLGVAVGIFFRIVSIGKDSLWFDEGYSAWMISHRFSEIIRLVKADTSPPLFYLLLRAWSLVFGRSEIALRSLSMLFSIAILFLIVALARRILKKPPAIALATWIAAFSFLLVEFAQEARCYSMLAFLCLAALYCLVRHLQDGRWRWIILIALSLAAALYIHNIAGCYVLALVPVWLILPSNHSILRRLRDGFITAALIGVMYIPWAIVLGSQVKMVQQGFWVLPPTLQDISKVFSGIAGVRHFWRVDEPLSHLKIPFWFLDLFEGLGTTIVCAAIIVAYFSKDSRAKRNTAALAIYALLPPLAVAIYSCWGTPLLMDKVFLTSATIIPILLLIPAAASNVATKKIDLTLGWIAVILAAWSLWGFKIEHEKENWRAAAHLVSALPPDHRLIVCVANDGQLPFDYYYHLRPGEDITGVPTGFFDRDPPRTMLRALQNDDLDNLKAILNENKYPEVVLVLAHTSWADPQNRTQALMERMYLVWEISELHDVKIVRYRVRRSGEFPPLPHSQWE